MGRSVAGRDIALARLIYIKVGLHGYEFCVWSNDYGIVCSVPPKFKGQ